MKSKTLYIVLALLLVASMVLAACQPAAEEPAVEEPAATEEMAAEEPMAEGTYYDRAMAGEFAGTVVTMTGPFTDEDAVKFDNSVAAFEEATGIDIQYEGSKEFEASIGIRVEAGDAPDIVDFPQPGLLATFVAQGKVVDVSGFLPQSSIDNYNPSWWQMATMAGADGPIVAGVWHRFNAKSQVWYPKAAFDAAGYTIPTTWDEMLALSDQIVADGDTPWCVGIESGAATGWPATDWMEEIMLRTTSLENYDKWVTGELPFSSPEVKNALTVLTDLWSDAYVYGGQEAIVTTFFGDAPTPMFENPPKCWLHKQGNFITSFFPEGVVAGEDYGFFYLPGIDAEYGKPYLVAGDIMAMFNERDEVKAVMEFFTKGEALKEWLAAGGALAPQMDTDLNWYGDEIEKGIAALVADATSVRFDGSDLMPGEVGAGSFWKGMTDYFSGTADMDTVMAEIDASWPGKDMMEEAPAAEAPAADDPCAYGGKIKSITAVDDLTVEFAMCKPDPAFPAKAAFTPFGIYPSEWLMANANADNQETLLSAPVGTGPFMLTEWARGDSVTMTAFADYWGEKAPYTTLVFRWATEGAARLLELQSGTVDQITNLSPDDFATVQGDPNLTFLPVANPNTLYLAMTNTFEPFNDVKVRQAVAMGIDRQRIVDFFYPEGSEVASHFTPCSIANGCAGDDWYEFDAAAAKALLAEAGYPDGFKTTIYYRDVFRGYLPEPGLVAVEFQTQLRDNLGIEADVVVMESGEFIDESTNGRLDGFYLLGWGADYPHVTNFLDFHFAASNPQFGDPFPEIYEVLQTASQIGDPAKAEALYVEANNAIKELVPMVPIAHGASASAALATVENAHFRPFGAPLLNEVNPGKDTYVYMQNAEPISLFCQDETDGESLAPCQQIVETLLGYAIDSGNVVPQLATSCEPNDDSTVWTCYLREGVLFHDGTTLDATDVVTSWMAGIDAANPYHIGNTGAFEYYSYLWDGLMNAGE